MTQSSQRNPSIRAAVWVGLFLAAVFSMGALVLAAGPDRRALAYAAAINGAYYGRTVRWGIRGWDPEGECSPSERTIPEIG